MKTDTEKASFVPMKVEYQPAWLTWVASVTSCLKALNVDCDLVDVAGVSGYAFYMSIHFELCPSGPTVVPMGRLLFGLTTLGRTTLNYQCVDIEMNEPLSDKTRDACKYAYDLVSREISEGRPCVIWGAYVPEYAVAHGVGDGSFHVKSFKECLKEDQPPIPYDKISAPGGPYILAFPNPTEGNLKKWKYKHSIRQAVHLLKSPPPILEYGWGLGAYDWWIKGIDNAPKKRDVWKFGNAYNSQCWMEAKYFAKEFIKRIPGKVEKIGNELNEAIKHYEDTFDAMKKISTMFPFPHGDQLDDEKVRSEAKELLNAAKESESKAVEELERVLDLDWGE